MVSIVLQRGCQDCLGHLDSAWLTPNIPSDSTQNSPWQQGWASVCTQTFLKPKKHSRDRNTRRPDMKRDRESARWCVGSEVKCQVMRASQQQVEISQQRVDISERSSPKGEGRKLRQEVLWRENNSEVRRKWRINTTQQKQPQFNCCHDNRLAARYGWWWRPSGTVWPDRPAPPGAWLRRTRLSGLAGPWPAPGPPAPTGPALGLAASKTGRSRIGCLTCPSSLNLRRKQEPWCRVKTQEPG